MLGTLKKQRGFSLLELLMVLSLISLFTVSILYFSLKLYHKNQVALISDEISAAIAYARTLAVIQGQNLTLTKVSSCKDWSCGMLLRQEKNSTKEAPFPIHQWLWTSPGIKVEWKGFRSTSCLHFAKELKNSASSGRFRISYQQEFSQDIIVNRIGHARIEEH